MLEDLKAANREWVKSKLGWDKDYFAKHVAGQRPPYLWIGCADSRVPPNEMLGLGPGEVFIHRNVANQAPPKDLNYRSVLQYGVQVLGVKHILVVGHTGCGGIAASMDGQKHGLVDQWLKPVRKTYSANRKALKALPTIPERQDRLAELNVIEQVRNIVADPFVRDAWAQGRELAVHGWIYVLATGMVKDLEIDVTGPAEADRV
jgi:carbonic anhydrase